jgi:hypothetical protein
MSPILPTLKVPAKPYAKQNFERDCTKPTDATINGKKIPKRTSVGASTVLNASKVEIEKNKPTSATNCLLRTSPLPILQLPGMY